MTDEAGEGSGVASGSGRSRRMSDAGEGGGMDGKAGGEAHRATDGMEDGAAGGADSKSQARRTLDGAADKLAQLSLKATAQDGE